MARNANPTLIGGFVVGGLALATAAVFAFSGLDPFAEETSYVAYFESSVTGLDPGAPIRFHGVRVGRVSDVHAVYDIDSLDIMIPVTLTFEPGTVRLKDDVTIEDVQHGTRIEGSRDALDHMIRNGLRAELTMDSILTGKLYVALDYFPDERERYVNEGRVPLPEFPTTQSNLDKLLMSIEELPIEDMINDMAETIVAVRELVSSPKIVEVLDKLSVALDQVEPLSVSLRTTLDEVGRLAANVNNEVVPVTGDIRTMVTTIEESVVTLTASAETALAEAIEALEPLDQTFGNDYQILYRVQQLLIEMTEATRTVRNLTDHLVRHPESLLQGKK